MFGQGVGSFSHSTAFLRPSESTVGYNSHRSQAAHSEKYFWKRSIAVSPLLATGIFLCAVDLASALLATRLVGRLRAASLNPGAGAFTDSRLQLMLLGIASLLVLIPLLRLAAKLSALAVTKTSRWRPRTVVAALCVPASLCPVITITLLLSIGH